MGFFDYMKSTMRSPDELTPLHLAMLQGGAQMMANSDQGFGPAFGSGVSAGLNEYRRGISQAEELRKNKKLEELRQRQLDISAGHLAEAQSFHTRSLDVQEETAKQRRQLERDLQKSRIGAAANLQEDKQFFDAWLAGSQDRLQRDLQRNRLGSAHALQDDKQEFDWWLAKKNHERNLRLNSSDDRLKMMKANLYDTQNQQLIMQMEQLNALMDEGKDTSKVNDALTARGSTNKGIFDKLFGLPEEGEREPTGFFSDMSPEERAEFNRQRDIARDKTTKHKTTTTFNRNRINRAVRSIQLGIPIADKLTDAEREEVNRILEAQ